MNDISIIVPVYNDSDGIAGTLSSLLAVEYPSDSHEILVVDNGSTDGTRSTVEQFSGSADHVRLLVEDKIQGSYAARNRGIRHATGDLLVFIDANMTVERTWLQDLNQLFQETDCDYVGCDVELYFPGKKKTLAGLYSLATSFPVEYYICEQDFTPTCCLAFRRSVVQDIGPFADELTSGGDREFGQRVAQAGYNQRFAGDIIVYHPARITLKEHISKARRLGRGREQHYQQYRDSMDGRPWYHIRNVLPRHPVRFGKRLNRKYDTGLLLIFYTISYILKLSQASGQIEERFMS